MPEDFSRKRRPLAALALALVFSAAAQTPTTQVTLSFRDRLGPMQIDHFALGQGGLSEEPIWETRAPEIRALNPRLIRLFIQEYFDLLPEKGKFHFDTLDRSVDLILKTGATPLMCIAFKPHVLFPKIDQDIVEPNDYDQWEDLVFHLVQHYQQRGACIRYWEVSNEPDIGEDGGCPYRFRAENYPRYYQHTAAAILRADPEARVGGPALAGYSSAILPALLNFCQAQKVPLHFVSWHIYSSDPRQIRATIDNVKSLLRRYPELKPETILDEWNMSLGTPPDNPRLQPCFIAEVAWQMKEAGLDYSCYYHIRDYPVSYERFAPFMSLHGTAFMAKWWNRMPQFDGLFDFQNSIRPSYFAFKLISRLTGERLRLTSDNPAVHGFATWDERFRNYNLLLWNFSEAPAPVEVKFEGMPPRLAAQAILLDAGAPSPDENSRLKPADTADLRKNKPYFQVLLGPYAMKYWSLEEHK